MIRCGKYDVQMQKRLCKEADKMMKQRCKNAFKKDDLKKRKDYV